MEEHSHQNCSFSLASIGLKHQDSTPLISYQWLPPVAIRRVFPGWIQVLSYWNRRGSRTKRGVRAYRGPLGKRKLSYAKRIFCTDGYRLNVTCES
uniref:Uncharacterized protein n=1 Tax=Escherichia coli TaxID=562 RepID=A0A7G9A9Z9_ECOLX|nr:hypothetical protein [Escherichia coli]